MPQEQVSASSPSTTQSPNDPVAVLITEYERKRAEAVDQIQRWNATALKAEGALTVLYLLQAQGKSNPEDK